MKKISLILLSMVFAATNAMAKSIVFTLTNGTEIYYLLGGEKNPVMTFNEGKVIVNADEYQISEIRNFRFSETDDPTGIEQILTKAEISYSNNQFVVKSADVKGIKVFSINGTLVKTNVTTEEGFTTINLSELPAGIYIIKIGDSSMKVEKK